MPEYVWMCQNIPWKWQSSEYDSVVHVRSLHSVLNMSEYALREFWVYFGF